MGNSKIKYLLIFWLISNQLLSQVNLVPNPSFESYTTCPTVNGNIIQATGWSSYRGSPDYYNACNGNGGEGVPSNGVGYQTASTGSGYAGFVAYVASQFGREIIGGPLSQTMVIGQTYYVSIKVSLAEFDAVTKQFIPCNKVGIKFSKVSCQGSDSPHPGPNPAQINNFAHVYTNSKINDTLNWTTISGSFIADSAYKYIMVGNFFDDANTDTTYRGALANYSYFFLDDICVSTSSISCIDNTTGVETIQKHETFKLYPNPAISFLKIENSNKEESTIRIEDFTGEELFREKFTNDLNIDISGFPNGIYFIKIKSKQDLTTKKIIINH